MEISSRNKSFLLSGAVNELVLLLSQLNDKVKSFDGLLAVDEQ